MEEKTWIDYAVAFGSVATPLLVIILSAIGWRFKSSIERKITLEDKLRDDRIDIYNNILEPFIILLMSDEAWSQDKKNKNKDKNELAISKMLSLEYRKHGFKLALMGSDPIVKSYNNLMQYFYNMEENQSNNSNLFLKEMLELLGTFLLEIRRSMGNEATKLDCWDMCEWWMSDTRKVKDSSYNNT
jgi:hypothetical protein